MGQWKLVKHFKAIYSHKWKVQCQLKSKQLVCKRNDGFMNGFWKSKLVNKSISKNTLANEWALKLEWFCFLFLQGLSQKFWNICIHTSSCNYHQELERIKLVLLPECSLDIVPLVLFFVLAMLQQTRGDENFNERVVHFNGHCIMMISSLNARLLFVKLEK